MKNRVTEHLPKNWRSALDSSAETLKNLGTPKEWLDSTEQLIRKNPGTAILIAFAAGATVAWWLKRR